MEVRKPVSAEEERRQKLLEYLAAKGKLKPQNNKPYLKDSTNLQKKPLTHRSKAPQINKQKEDVVPKKTKHIPKASSNLPLQRQTKMVHSKMSARDNVSATSKPRSRTMPSAAVPSKNVIPCKSLKQKKGETQVTADTASCAILCNSGKEAEAGEESGERILLIEPKGKQCSLNIDGENFINENRTAELLQ
ncbi:cytoskeleton-associated protein 2-like [Spea bombifrons]|uniref:cytoskeleton-associated protein 2-like n=1 Tax=Spea bombifrons TaxID=233779 RepID=UPI0023495545|nr:cytoskeleton-associated protein 2-like [Spea bombifrons]